MRCGKMKRGESKLAKFTSLCVLHSLDRSEVFMELYREEEREEVDRGGQEDKRGESKAESQIQLVINSLSVLHHLEHTEIHRVG